MKHKILVTGVSGFLGQYLAKALLTDGHDVHGMYEHPESMDKNPELLEDNKHLANLRSKTEVEAVVKKVQPNIVIHLAAKTEVALSFANYAEVSEVNYLGTVNLAEACRQFAPDFKLFLMASTMETYGHQDPKNGAFTEETEQRPMAPYAVAKLACEKYLRYMEYAYNFPFCALRQTNTYGRTDNDFFVVERIVTQMLKGNYCGLGEPDPVRNFLWVDDLIDLYLAVIDQIDKAKGEIFVTGPDNALRIDELADKIKAKLNWQGRIEWHTIEKRPGEIYYLNSNPAKAERVLGWKPKVSLDEGLDKVIAIWKEKYHG